MTSTFLHSLAIALTSVLPSPELQITLRTSGQLLKTLWAWFGTSAVRTLGNDRPSKADLRLLVILICAKTIDSVCRLGRARRQLTKAGRTVAVEQRERRTLTHLLIRR
jgi:hypothetical protein